MPKRKERVNAKRPTQPKAQMNLVKLMEQFGSEDKCHAYLETLRWPGGVECPRCGADSISRIHTRRLFECNSCEYQFSVRVGTIFDRSHLPLWKWFLAVYLIGESKKGISSKQLERVLDVSYRTAWFLSHRIRAAMEDDSPIPLRGIVEIDETFIGGRRKMTKAGPHAGKAMVLGAIQRGGDVRLKVQSGPRRKHQDEIQRFVRETVHDDASAIHTDSAKYWGDLSDHNTAHHKVSHAQEEWVRGVVRTKHRGGRVEPAQALCGRHLPSAFGQAPSGLSGRSGVPLQQPGQPVAVPRHRAGAPE
ncbi:MAG TPA: IS1595 family transposase [Thermoleophilaceae bacterium]|nr:IS1595 family transposase [Thermoleophilaceae bacterium]